MKKRMIAIEMSNGRDSTLEYIDVFLDSALDLVTIQLGENSADVGTYQENLASLVDYIEEAAPNAQIIIDDFWRDKVGMMQKAATDEKVCCFANLSDIRGKKEYQSEEGLTCILEDGSRINVPEEAAMHPGDEGMMVIAERVIEMIE